MRAALLRPAKGDAPERVPVEGVRCRVLYVGVDARPRSVDEEDFGRLGGMASSAIGPGTPPASRTRS